MDEIIVILSTILYCIGAVVSLNIIEKRHRREKIDYSVAFMFCTLSWFAVFLLMGKTALNNIVDIWKRK